MLAEQIQTEPTIPHDVEVMSASFARGEVAVILESILLPGRWRVRFYGSAGMRVLDEGDLLEFWPTCSSPNGPLFKIIAGGWKEQENDRGGFLKRETQPDLPEYFVAGRNACVNVFSHSAPEVSFED